MERRAHLEAAKQHVETAAMHLVAASKHDEGDHEVAKRRSNEARALSKTADGKSEEAHRLSTKLKKRAFLV
jgi:hypothetical protein